MKKINNYWLKRMAESAQRKTEYGINAINNQIQKYYIECQKKVIRDFKELYTEILLDKEAGKEILVSRLYQLDKYWKLQGELQNELEKLGNKSTKTMSRGFKTGFREAYNNFEIPTSAPYFTTLDNTIVNQVVDSIWCSDGKRWSDRVWENTSKLQYRLNQELIHCITTGKKPTQLVNELRREFGVSYNQANTLVRTEMAHIETEGALRRYKDAGIREIEVYAGEPDDRLCETCASHNGKHFPIDENPIPFHPNCRCCVLPVIKEAINDKDRKK